MSEHNKTTHIVYPGFFDPFTLGHFNIVKRAAKLYAKVVIAVAKESPKQALFSLEDRVALIENVCADFENVHIESFSGLLIEYVKQSGFNCILRGIRTVSDFEYEFQMSLANKTLDSSIETVFMMTDAKYTFISSSFTKEIARLGGDISKMVPKDVESALRKKFEYE